MRVFTRAVRTVEEIRELLAGKGRIVATWHAGDRIVQWVRMTPDIVSRQRISEVERKALAKLARLPALQRLHAEQGGSHGYQV